MIQVYLRRGEDAYALLADALALHGTAPLPRMTRTGQGKPFFPDEPGLHFNLSHSGGLLLCAVADRPVGVDVEVVRPRKPSLPRYCLTDGEYEIYRSAGETWEAFYHIWTQKEAWCKYLGVGLGHPKDWPTPPACLHRTYCGNGFRACVCAGEPPGELVEL